MASPTGESSNQLLHPETTDELFQTLEGWSDYLDRHTPNYVEETPL